MLILHQSIELLIVLHPFVELLLASIRNLVLNFQPFLMNYLSLLALRFIELSTPASGLV